MTKDDPEKEGEENKKTEEIEPLEERSDEVEYEPVPQEDAPSAKAEKKEEAGLRLQAEEDKGLKGKLKKKDAEIKSLKKEHEELKDKYLRKLAEMENLRKRFDRERDEYQQYALTEFLRELLVVLDNFERAIQNKDRADGKGFQEGVELIYRQYLDLLKKKGVRPIVPADKKFDPAIHQAVLTEESEAVAEPEVAEELQRGYWIQDKLLRPALVKVLVPKKREET